MRIRLRHRKLHDLLERSARSQNAWAARVGVSRGHWSDLVNGKHLYPSAKTRRLILDAFQVRLEELFVIERVARAEPETALWAALSERYVIDRLVGEGAMGVVYLARDLRFGRRVAIKMVAAEALGNLGVDRFSAEIQRMARLQHPNILPLLDAGEAEGCPYYVTPYVEGGSLRDRLARSGRLPIAAALTILEHVAAALDHAHDHDLLHCDVKPENILLVGNHAYVADFGLARAVHHEALREWEHAPEIDVGAGTPAYVSPEQARAEPRLDRRSDVYSLACVAFEMLVGRPPFCGAHTTEIVKRRFDSVPPDAHEIDQRVPRAVAEVLAAAMSQPRDGRPASATKLVRRIRLAAAAARPPSSDTRTAAHAALSAVTAWALARDKRPRGSLMRNILDDLRYSARSLISRPLFALVAIATLALGIGANAAIFSVVNAVVLRPLPFPEPERLLRVYSSFEGRRCCPLSTPNFLDLRASVGELEDIVGFSNGVYAVTGGGEPVRLPGKQVSAGFFELLGAAPQIGRLIEPQDDAFGSEPVVVISDRLWRDRFDRDRAILGEALIVDSIPRTIVGVAPPGFALDRESPLYLPFAWDLDNLPSRGQNWVTALGRLRSDATPASARAELEALYGGLVADFPDLIVNDGIDILSLDRVLVASSQRQPLLLLWGAVGMVLLVACVNVVNLMLARAETRQLEIAVRAALGASRGALMRHFVVESVAISLLGGAVGVAAAYGGLRLLLSEFGGAIPRSEGVSVDTTALLFSVAVSLATGLAVGLVPALRTRLSNLAPALSEGGRGLAASSGQLRRSLVVLEVAAALILVVGAGLMLKSFWRLSQVDVGVEPARILAARVSLPASAYPEQSDRAGFWEALRNRLARQPGVEQVGLTSAVPFSNTYNNMSRIMPVDDPERVATFVETRSVDNGFFATLELELSAGRLFTDADVPDNPTVVIINRALARRLFDASPVGRRITWSPEAAGFEVVGVVESIYEHGPDRNPPPTIYYSTTQGWRSTMSVTLRATGEPLDLVPFVRGTVRDLDADLPVYAVRRLDQMIADGLGSRRFSMSLLAIFAAIALSLGAIGIYGVMAYSVEGRTREIGIRQALGASRGSVLTLVVSQGGRMTLVGIAIGVFGAYLLREAIGSLLFEVSGFDAAVYLGVAAVLGLVSIAACYVPALRAAAIDPMEALRKG